MDGGKVGREAMKLIEIDGVSTGLEERDICAFSLCLFFISLKTSPLRQPKASFYEAVDSKPLFPDELASTIYQCEICECLQTLKNHERIGLQKKIKLIYFRNLQQ